MSDEEMFEVFRDFNPREHEDEAAERWGDTEAYPQSAERTKRYRKDDWLQIRAETDAISAAFAQAMDAGIEATSTVGMEIAERHRRHISRWFYECSPEFHRNLGEMQVEDERFAATWDAVRPGLARYIRDAFVANADAQK